jgi:hypothetical protein
MGFDVYKVKLPTPPMEYIELPPDEAGEFLCHLAENEGMWSNGVAQNDWTKQRLLEEASAFARESSEGVSKDDVDEKVLAACCDWVERLPYDDTGLHEPVIRLVIDW